MGTNIEIKAKVKNPNDLHRLLEKCSDTACEVILQEDIFFRTVTGRLKLRVSASDHSELIYYERENSPGPKRSKYLASRCTDPAPLRTLLATALGIRGVVRKRRWLYSINHTRIHVDDVEGLGPFVEIEVVLNEGQTLEDGETVADEIMKKLDIHKADLVEEAYIDLLERNTTCFS
ncbi:MAG TPA: class IV adenylate cyclase [Candidatus Udaeobacter sp.]|jgi:predicted adenylyl cyclase CyaB|nr:class IV adenylate cyclase [Candidatus Udaeobacter sp.]